MQDVKASRRAGYLILCMIPALVGPLTAIRALRVPVVHEALGILSFGTIVVAGWWLTRPKIEPRDVRASLLQVAGVFLLTPTALIALLGVGLATPWDATPPENKLRYAVLLAGSIGVTIGFVVLKEALCESGERLFSAVALAASLLSGAAYVVWTSFQLGDFALRLSKGEASPAIASMNNVLDALLFAAGTLTYFATAAFAEALARAGLLGKNASRVYVALNLLAVTLLALRGVSFESPAGDPSPWYTRPGFIVGIPAVPWFMPYFLGVVLLWRAGAIVADTNTSRQRLGD